MKLDIKYSLPCNVVKKKAKITVIAKPYNAPFLLPCIIEWRAKVTENSDDNNIIVLSIGNSKALTVSIPEGGQCAPNSTLGEIALWKNVQNIAKKKKFH